MQDRHEVPEGPAEAGDRLGRQRDLGDQHERTLAPPQHAADQLDVDERLARARDAVQEKRPAPPPQRPHHAAEHAALARGGGWCIPLFHRLLTEGIAQHHFVRYANQALRLQPADHASAESLLGERRDGLSATRFEEPLEGFPLPLRPPEDPLELREGADRPHNPGDHPSPRRRRSRRGQHGAEHHPDRRHIILGNPAGEIQKFAADRGARIQHGEDIAHAGDIPPGAEHPPGEGAVAEGNLNARSGRRRRAGHPVGEQTAHRQRQRHLDEGGTGTGHRCGAGAGHGQGAGPGAPGSVLQQEEDVLLRLVDRHLGTAGSHVDVDLGADPHVLGDVDPGLHREADAGHQHPVVARLQVV